ncbi:ABC transporter permease [Halostella salina]|uniref:ABC transporter permease n=1 Tax=Halostella salina TaxID=1547897 RepID=UPI000EF818B2|nr:ABC transporter permease [Halostella salina]
MSSTTIDRTTISEPIRERYSQFRQTYYQLDTSARISFWIVFAIVNTAIFAPILAPYDPAALHYDASLQGPSVAHPLGADLLGRDILSRLIFGTRASLAVGVIAVGMAILIGVPLGSIAGYVGGWTDEVIMRFMDVIISIPALVLGLAIVGAIGAGIVNVIAVVAIVYSPQYARIIRGSVLSVKEEEYVEAAKNTGLGKVSILVKHVLPNSFTPVIVQGTYHVATAIILEASLSFLGLGVQPPRPTWGMMIASGRQYLPGEWWISVFPGIAIMITVLAFNILGDGLQDEFDPRSETETGGGA